jgi:hypothetical protein
MFVPKMRLPSGTEWEKQKTLSRIEEKPFHRVRIQPLDSPEIRDFSQDLVEEISGDSR